MRGLPSCGKSHTAKLLAGDSGIVCETDEYFYTQVGEDPTRFDYREELMDAARAWNFKRFEDALERQTSPIVVDRGNGLSTETQRYARLAIDSGYHVELKEPDSEWWREVRVLLKYRPLTRPILERWAEILARMSDATHRVPKRTIVRRMDKWKFALTVEDILDYAPGQASQFEGSGPSDAASDAGE